MALLTNIDNKFSVSDAGAVRFNNAFTFPTADGTANYVLKTNGSGQLAWAADNNNGDITGSGTANTVTKFTGAKVIGNGPITFATNDSTFAGSITGTRAFFNSGTTNVVATFTSTDGTAGIGLIDSSGSVELSASGDNFQVQPAGGTAQLTVGSSASTFAGTLTATNYFSSTTAANIFLGSVITKPGDNLGFVIRNSSNTIIGSFLRTSNTASKLTTDNLSLGGTTAQYVRGDGSFATFSPGTGTVTGTGAANRVTYWSSATNVTSDAGFTYNGAGRVNTDESFGVSKDGANTVADGPFFRLTNAAQDRQYLWQLDASNNIDYWYYNGSTWAQTISLLNNGGATFAGDITLTPGNSNKIILTPDVNSHYITGNAYWVDVVGNAAEVFRVFGGVGGTSEYFRITGTGAISVGNTGTNYGTSGEVLISNGNISPTWGAATSVSEDNYYKIDDGLNFYLAFKEGSGTTVADVSGGRNNFTAGVGLDWSETGRFGYAQSFNGSNSYLNGTGPSSNITTFSAWVNNDGDGGIQNIVSGTYIMAYVSIYNNNFMIYDGIAWRNGGAVPANEWVHVAFSYDAAGTSGGLQKMYVNGVLGYSATAVGYTGVASYISKVGIFTGAIRYFNGEITAIKTWDRILGDSEILAIYNQTALNENLTVLGNVGIGTTSPINFTNQTSLTVSGTSIGRVDVRVTAGGGGGIYGSSSQMKMFANYGMNLALESGTGGVTTFTTGGTERMRIKSDGNILVADTRKIQFYNTSQYIYANSTNDLTLASGDDINFQTNYARFFHAGVEGARISATTNSWLANGSNGKLGINRTDPGYNLDVSGTIRATGDIIAYSDVRVKENIKTIKSSLDKVSKLRGVEFNKIGEDEKSIGVIAQEIEKIIPEVVKTDDEGMKSVAYGNISGLLIEAIKELKAEIEELKFNKCNCK